MTTLAPERRGSSRRPAAPATARVTLMRTINSEWVKFRSLRSTWFSLLGALVVAVGLSFLFTSLHGHEIATRGASAARGGFDPVQMSLRGLMLAQLATGVLGVLFITGEYGTGMIRASLAAVPHRWPVLAGKAVVLAVTTFVIGAAGSLVAFLVGQAALDTNQLGVGLGSPGALRAVLGGGLYLTVVALLGLGCGFLVRNTGGAIATVFGLLLVLPILGEALPSSWSTVNEYLPMNAGMQILRTTAANGSIPPWTGIGVFAGWALLCLVLGLVTLRTRDA